MDLIGLHKYTICYYWLCTLILTCPLKSIVSTLFILETLKWRVVKVLWIQVIWCHGIDVETKSTLSFILLALLTFLNEFVSVDLCLILRGHYQMIQTKLPLDKN